VVLAYWSGALLASRWGPGLLLVGVAGGVVVQLALGRGVPVGRPVAIAAAIVALVLTAAMDLHGAAMVAGIVIAAVIGRGPRRAGSRRPAAPAAGPQHPAQPSGYCRPTASRSAAATTSATDRRRSSATR